MSGAEHILKMAAKIIVAAVVFGVVTMLLWNILMPGIFSLPAIGFLQAVGLILLARLLFGSLGGHLMKHRHHHNMIHEKWKNMSPEDRQAFMNSHHHHFFGGRCRSRGEHRTDGNGAGASGENKE